MILFDTSTLSMIFRRRKLGPTERRIAATVELLFTEKRPLGLPGLVLQEVLSGVRSEKQFVELEGRLRTAFDLLLASEVEHIEAARLRNRCRAKGISASNPDCLIAAQAIVGGHELFTSDRDFAEIAKHAPLKLFHVS